MGARINHESARQDTLLSVRILHSERIDARRYVRRERAVDQGISDAQDVNLDILTQPGL